MRTRIILVNPDEWDSLRAWGAALHARGVSVCLVHEHDYSWPRRIRDRLVFGEWPVTSLSAALARGSAYDIVTTEEQLAKAWNAGEPIAVTTPRVLSDCSPTLLWNKWDMTRYADRLGLSIPETWSSDPQILPLVVKGRVGAGGRAVRVVNSERDRDDAVRELGDVFFQEVVPGTVINVSGVVRQGEVCCLAAYRAIAPDTDPLGPPTRLEIIDGGGPVGEAKLLLKDLTFTGVVALDYIQAHDGRWWLLDVNPRPFGGWLALQRAGVDLVGMYLALLNLEDMPDDTSLTPGVVLNDHMLPTEDPEHFGDVIAAGRQSWRTIAQAARITGWCHAAPIGVRSIRTSLRQMQTILRYRAKTLVAFEKPAASVGVAPLG